MPTKPLAQPQRTQSAEEFYKVWIAQHPKLLGKSVTWPISVCLFEFAEAYAQSLKQAAAPQLAIEVIDYAAGAEGTYCIGRKMGDNHAFMEFWNPHGWAGSGYVFSNKTLAHALCGLLSGSKPRCVDCNAAGITNCSHFDDCSGRWVYGGK